MRDRLGTAPSPALWGTAAAPSRSVSCHPTPEHDLVHPQLLSHAYNRLATCRHTVNCLSFEGIREEPSSSLAHRTLRLWLENLSAASTRTGHDHSGRISAAQPAMAVAAADRLAQVRPFQLKPSASTTTSTIRPRHSRGSLAPIPSSSPSFLTGPQRPSCRIVSPSRPPSASACRRHERTRRRSRPGATTAARHGARTRLRAIHQGRGARVPRPSASPRLHTRHPISPIPLAPRKARISGRDVTSDPE